MMLSSLILHNLEVGIVEFILSLVAFDKEVTVLKRIIPAKPGRMKRMRHIATMIKSGSIN